MRPVHRNFIAAPDAIRVKVKSRRTICAGQGSIKARIALDRGHVYGVKSQVTD
jgi:hypothetical protein